MKLNNVVRITGSRRARVLVMVSEESRIQSHTADGVYAYMKGLMPR